MQNEFTLVMSKRSDGELLRILTEDRHKYQPEAIVAAELEFSNRNLSPEQIEAFKLQNEQVRENQEFKAQEPLSSGWKVVSFIFPGIIAVIFSGALKTQGYRRKSQELFRWTIYGFGFYFGLAIIIGLS